MLAGRAARLASRRNPAADALLATPRGAASLLNELDAAHHKQDEEHDQDSTDQTATDVHAIFLPGLLTDARLRGTAVQYVTSA